LYRRYVQEAVGSEFIEQDRADVILMGCAGMAPYRHALEAALSGWHRSDPG
jgi:Asp/Glu/hydantoin racemase